MDLNLNQLDNKEILNYLTNGKYNVIFGAGSVGGLLINALKNLDVSVYSFLVNDNHKIKESFNGIDVYELSEFPLRESECNILYAIDSKSSEILNPLKDKIKENIMFVNGMEGIFKLLNIYYTEYFEEHNVDITKQVIDFNKVKIINPFLSDKGCLNAFLFEIGDLILPEIMNDYSKINEGPYEYKNVILQENDVVFDCGANIGLFSSIAASKKCIIYAFEPVPETKMYLDRLLELYPKYINICEYALSDSEGNTKIYISQDTNISNSMLGINQDMSKYIEVSMTTIDQFVKENKIEKVDFIKADIEGAERYMIKGAKETLAKFAPKISICTYHLEDDPKVLEDLIKDANPNYIIEHKWKKLYAYVPMHEQLK